MVSTDKQHDFNGIIEPLKISDSQCSTGPLAGTTFVAKDNFAVAGLQTGAGVPDWKRTHPPATVTATAITLMLRAGSTLIGKSCMDELAFGLDGINIHYGISANPNLPGHIPGGSSSGSASAVALGLCDFGLGTDTAGSIRVPAAFCGIYSMRPTHGRVPIDGVVPLGPSFDTVGWFARDPKLLTECGAVLLGEKLDSAIVPTKKPKIALLRNCFDLVDESIRTAFDSATKKLLARISDQPVDSIELSSNNSLEHWISLLDTIRSWEAWQYFGSWINETNPHMQDVVERRFLNCEKTSEGDKIAAVGERQKVIAYLDHLLADQIICIPTVFNFPASCDASEELLASHRRKNLLMNSTAAIGGLPQVNIPLSLPGEKARLGLSFMARRGADCELLNLVNEFCGTRAGILPAQRKQFL